MAIAITILSACNSGNQASKGADSANVVHPATPDGTVSVTIGDREKDTSQITISFQVKGLKKEKTFDQVILKDVSDTDLFKVLWDQPNSVYVAVLKPSHNARYYHGSISDGEAKIFVAATPPKRIWMYMEDSLGLGKLSGAKGLVASYRKDIQSGKILGQFIAEVRPIDSVKNVELYVEFGGVTKKMNITLPLDTKAMIQPTKDDSHVYFSFVKGEQVDPIIDLYVENGRLQVKTLKEIN
ncbi:hypothetical protein DVR12_06820 [Chitinophaga silvatica]|uniref:Uncharacterized protein n=2 Tax=Chitinophaga silvatica TaxID=2282649 RepID=A0A3E1YEI1_9BACT|nr:hypothetical protein DVR12_06820 [Chitinophaga silvatica]